MLYHNLLRCASTSVTLDTRYQANVNHLFENENGEHEQENVSVREIKMGNRLAVLFVAQEAVLSVKNVLRSYHVAGIKYSAA